MPTFDQLTFEQMRREVTHCIMLGKLSEESPLLPNLGVERKSVTINRLNPDQINIYIQSLTKEPKFIEETGKDPRESYITFDDRNSAFLRKIKYNEKLSASERVEFLYEYLQNKLILFRPKLSYRNPRGGEESHHHQFHYNFEFVQVLDDPIRDSYYIPVPRVNDQSANRFEKLLLEQKPFRLLNHPNLFEAPEFIICEKNLYYVENDPFETIPSNRSLYYCKNPEGIKRLTLPEEWTSHTQGVYQDMAFITNKFATDIRDLFHEQGTKITDAQDNSVIQNKKIVTTVQNREPAVNPEVEETPLSDSTLLINEAQFINKLKYLAQKEELIYGDYDLINFHTALKTSPLTILGGMSGTGKTRLARLYAKALGLKNGENLLILPISPSFTEPSDLLGFLNQQMGIYMESETGLVSFLNHAAEDQEKMYMIIFDEMNLGQVEHYFAPFISLLEMDEEDRYLTLYSESAMSRDKSLARRIKIGSNVLMVGTANFDETTKDFSKRLLDRTNVIFLEKTDFVDAKNQVSSIEEPSSQILELPINSTIFRGQWTKERKGIKYLGNEELELLETIHRLMRSVDAQTGVSFRIANGVSSFLQNIPLDEDNNPFMSRDVAFDYQIKQRLLTKIRGHREQIEHLVGSYDLEKEKYEPGDLVSAIENEDWKLDRSKRFLEQKAKELTRNGYTL